jgi:transposase
MHYELTDHEWTVIKPMLPNKPRGVPRVNDRRVLNGIFWVLRSGAPWRAICRRYGRARRCPRCRGSNDRHVHRARASTRRMHFRKQAAAHGSIAGRTSCCSWGFIAWLLGRWMLSARSPR